MNSYKELRNILMVLIQQTCHTICYIRKNTILLNAIEDYCKELPIGNSNDLNEKAYWFLHELQDYPICQCDGCDKKVKFRTLRKGYATACCTKHAAIVSRPFVAATNLERYGSTTPLQNKEIRDQINKHNIETYGMKHVVQSEYFKQKRIETCQKNFGVDYPMQSHKVMQKRIETCRKDYGVEYAVQNEDIKQKRVETSLKLYGCKNPMQNDEIKAKSRATMQQNYGVNAPAQCPEIRRKQQTKCEYKGISFDSIYEIAYYIWLTDHKIAFSYEPNTKFKYMYGDKEHWYMPDFVVCGQYIEIKGDHFFKDDGTMQNPWDHSQDALYEAKHQCMLHNNVKIIRISEMKEVLDYVYAKYGKNYLKQFRRRAKKTKTI